MKLDWNNVTEIAKGIGVDYASLMAFISVESGGIGFSTTTGKIIIQFEPSWFKRYVKVRKPTDIKYWSIIDSNKVEGQSSEWLAFNAAYKIDPKAALLSTSIGLMQVMGFNYFTMGYKSVNDMWDDFKTGEYAQLKGAAAFIKNNPKLYSALKSKDWAKVAYYYNGSNYKVNNYDVKLLSAYNKYSK
jgi:hypothetical protein